MKILFLTLGNQNVASSRTRVFQYIPHFSQRHIVSSVIVYNRFHLLRPHRFWAVVDELLAAAKIIVFAPFYDVVFIQKVFLPVLLFKYVRSIGKKIVFDFDDAIHVDVATSKVDDARSDALINSIILSHLVVLENDENWDLVKKYNANILKITGPIDTDRYSPVARSGAPCIGWIGSPTTTKQLKMLFPVFRQLKEEFPVLNFVFIGADVSQLEDFVKYSERWTLDTELQSLAKIHIGIMPLVDDEWTRGKGGYKLLQYMAMGIPSVASPVGVNKDIITENSNGYLANSDAEWLVALRGLINNPQKCYRMGTSARGIAEEKYSFYAAVPVLLERISLLS